jgi:hypothetical protein
MLASCLSYFLTLKMEAIRSSETLVSFQRTTQCFIPEVRTVLTIKWDVLSLFPKTSYGNLEAGNLIPVRSR